MVGAWRAYDHLAKNGGTVYDYHADKQEQSIMAEIERYNEVDCRVMWEALSWLRNQPG
jgi:predicted RecB family nuclease